MCGFQGTRNRRWSARCAESSQDGSFGYEVTKRKPRGRRTAQTLHSFPVTMAKGIHLFPYRTQKLSLSAPMVLGWRRPGRVGRCRIPKEKGFSFAESFFFCPPLRLLSQVGYKPMCKLYLEPESSAPCGRLNLHFFLSYANKHIRKEYKNGHVWKRVEIQNRSVLP